MAYTSEDGCLRLMNFATGDFAGCHDPAGATSDVVWSPDERLIACGMCGDDSAEITVLKPPNFTMFFPQYYLDGERPDELDDDDDGEWRDPAVLCRLDNGPEQAGSGGEFCRYFAWVDSTTLVSAHRGRNAKPRTHVGAAGRRRAVGATTKSEETRFASVNAYKHTHSRKK